MRRHILGAVLAVAACSAETAQAPSEPVADVIQRRLQEEFAPPAETAPWKYTSTHDQMRDRRRFTGCTNGLTDDGGISGDPLVQLCIRTDEGADFNVVTLISSDMFDCPIRTCNAVIKIGDDPVERWQIASPDAGAATFNIVGFVRSADLLDALRTAPEIWIELPLYDNGTTQLRFETRGLNWPPPEGAFAER